MNAPSFSLVLFHLLCTLLIFLDVDLEVNKEGHLTSSLQSVLYKFNKKIGATINQNCEVKMDGIP
jgi:hypothetical protein